mgnify:CR=1 FL=1
MVDYLKEYAATLYTDEDVIKAKENMLLQHLLLKNLSYTVIFLNRFIQGKQNGSKTFGCQIKIGKTVMLMIPVLEFLKNYGDSGK